MLMVLAIERSRASSVECVSICGGLIHDKFVFILKISFSYGTGLRSEAYIATCWEIYECPGSDRRGVSLFLNL